MNLDPKAFFFEIPLYQEIEITRANWSDFTGLIQFRGKVEGFNPIRGEESTFKGYASVSGRIENGNLDYLFNYGEIFKLSIKCLRYDDELTYFVKYTPKFDKDEDGDTIRIERSGVLMKIGQNPSIAEFHIHQIKEFRSVLTKQKQRELVRAIGLASHGVGIGSYVYLRRIFEELIEEAHISAAKQDGWDEEAYTKARTSEKVSLLKNYLPEFLVENRSLYSILSKGIHELGEEECLTYFNTLRLGIERILEEKVDRLQKEVRTKEAAAKIAELNQKLGRT